MTMIHNLAAQLLALANNDIARAVTIMHELTGLSFETALEAIEGVMTIDEAQPPECGDPIEDESL
jgi:hypothetical protein